MLCVSLQCLIYFIFVYRRVHCMHVMYTLLHIITYMCMYMCALQDRCFRCLRLHTCIYNPKPYNIKGKLTTIAVRQAISSLKLWYIIHKSGKQGAVWENRERFKLTTNQLKNCLFTHIHYRKFGFWGKFTKFMWHESFSHMLHELLELSLYPIISIEYTHARTHARTHTHTHTHTGKVGK